MRTVRILPLLLVAAMALGVPGARAEELKPIQNPDGVKALVRLLEEKKVLTEDEANDFLFFWEEKRVQAKENNAETERKVLQASEWASRVRFGGDIRLRYEGKFYDKNNASFLSPTAPSTLENTSIDQQRARYRLRLGATAQINEDSEVGISLTTGSTSDPVSTNRTLGDYFNKDSILIDKAYLKVKPVDFMALWGGRMPMPFKTTDLHWDTDVNPEGFAAQFAYKVHRQVKLFGTAAAFTVQEVPLSQDDQWLFAGQVGADYSPLDYLKSTFAVSYWSYSNIRGRENPTGSVASSGPYNYTSPTSQQGGNSLFNINAAVSSSLSDAKLAPASKFHILDILFVLDTRLSDPYHVVFTGNYLRNVGFDLGEIRALTGNTDISRRNQAFLAGLKVGHSAIEKLADWQVYLTYKYLEGDAVFDTFTDSDFHGGGTNAQGWIMGVMVGIYQNMWLETKWITANEIDGPPLAVDTLQVDINARF